MLTKENIIKAIKVVAFIAVFAAIFYYAGSFDAELLEAGIIH